MGRLPLRRTRALWLSVTRLFLAGVLLGSATSAVMYERFTSRVPSAQAVLYPSLLRPESDQPPSLAGVATTAAQSVVYIATHKKRQQLQEFFSGSGALITKVDKEGPAEGAGLQIGDIICGYNGRHLTNSHELLLLISRTPVGTNVEVSLVRQLKLQTRKVKINKLIS